MPVSPHKTDSLPRAAPVLKIQMALAFFAIYVLWGCTFLAIRIAVEHIPPLRAAGIRFFIAGAILYLWARWRSAPKPTLVEWRNLAILGILMFLATYSALFWAEQRIPSGVAAVLVATLPIWTASLEVFAFRQERASLPLFAAIGLGFSGIALLTSSSPGGRLALIPCLAILGGEMCWALGSVLSRSIRLPQSRSMTAAAEMLIGGMALLICSVLAGEKSASTRVPLEAVLAIVYLVVAGSLLGFTAFVWLLERVSATQVSTHAYVNPVVALALGVWLGGEQIGWRTVVAAALILGSVVAILRSRSGQR
jgi:drug/metabolite transporter (DMT)-like permease